jgi:glycosyltransferase involved in cell wall biosynthesis
MNWHIVTCEYPPQVGGVGDYTRLLTRELQRTGDEVHVWAPPFDEGVQANVHRVLGDFSKRDLKQADALLDQHPAPRTLLVQWVPHGFGKHGMNLCFARWIASRARRGDRLYVMVHEPFLEANQRRWKHRLVAQVQRRMMRTALRHAARVFVSIPGWESRLRSFMPAAMRCEWLPIPATIESAPDREAIGAVRAGFPEGALLLGHLGTYSAEVASLLEPALIRTMEQSPGTHALLLGNNGDNFAARLQSAFPQFARRIHAPGRLSDVDLSHHLAACDLALQPYVDGLSSRRTSLMNVISHGIPTVSNTGHLTEPLWAESQAIALASTGDATQLSSLCLGLLRDESRRRQLAEAGRKLYASRFDWPGVVATLRSAACPGASTTSNHSAASTKLE